MLYDERLRPTPPQHPEIAIWRFMVDARSQRQGIGAAALEQVIAHAKARGTPSDLLVSYVPGPGCPEEFYLRAGFQHTGKMEGAEVLLGLPL